MTHDNHDHDSDPAADAALRALSAFVDGELPETDRAALRERVATDPQAAAQVASWRAQKAALQALCGEPAEHARPFVVLRPRVSRWRRVALAACWVAVGAGLGLACGTVVPRLVGGPSGETMALARRADIAFAVYSPEQRHPVEVAASQEEHLISWLSKRLNRPLSVPSLQEYGYSLVGGRLLPGEVGPAAQFMYENEAGARLTLYVASIPKDETAFRLFRDGNRRTFYWVSDRMGYALSGTVPEGKLRSMAIDVCNALGGRPESWQ
ncbi:anti-sigma factor family protein [Paraburkholderia sp.]|uniref:anti-sigma factor family protein n=1 Tax=Paraburkholderia sp. TaxID=1926495 RepID=UPI003D6FBB12